jgi:two-component system chemotaxis sensor kinase CheA
MVYGITSMLIGGLLVHFGQGPLQIEMHFYFFAMLAMLCLFANPAVNLAAAATVAVHHLSVYLLLPGSLLNYDAQWWVVGVHAAFVVLETVAACYISKQFFDNVIGLEKIIDARTATIREQQSQMKLILDNVAEGLITIELDGRISGSGSKVLQEWFGSPEQGQPLHEWIAEHDPNFAEWFELSLESVTDGFLPKEVAVAQMPSSMKVGDRNYTVSYQLISSEAEQQNPEQEQRQFSREEQLPSHEEKMLVVITDITEALIKEARERRQAELLELFQHINRDRAGFLEFLSEAEQLMTELSEGKYEDLDHLKRLVHTLKGNSAIFGMGTLSGLCHTIESKIADEGEAPSELEIKQVQKAWRDVRSDLGQILGDGNEDEIKLEDEDYQAILRAVVDGADLNTVRRMIESWQLEPAARRLQTVQTQLEGLAERLGKPALNVELASNDLRFDSGRFAPFWSAFIHVLRNTVDHGVEDADQRTQAGKTPGGNIKIETYTDCDKFVVAVSDDGPGVNWERLREKAVATGINVDSLEDPSELLFMTGLSSKTEVSSMSGRGVGMAAVAEACEALNGKVEVESETGKGTSIRFCFPKNESIYEGHSALLANRAA